MRRAAAEPGPATLGASITEFCALLRTSYGLAVGPEQARDALRALEAVGVERLGRVRSASRAVFCGRVEDYEPFERAFNAFFLTRRGVEQPRRSDRHTRPDLPAAVSAAGRAAQPAAGAPQDEGRGRGAPVERRPTREDAPPDEYRSALRERYSALPASAPLPEISPEGVERMLAGARRLVTRIRRGRSRRWTPQKGGERFDARRTLRGSVRTAGDPLVLHRLGHPLRNPRFVVFIDGSGSMANLVGPMLEFARALNRCTRRCATFAFSTALRDLTREFRRPGNAPLRPRDLRDAWGGGTRIGASLQSFLNAGGARLLTKETFVLIFSDGLDVDEVPALRRALREIRRRCAGIVWLNPHAGSPGYTPSARGMRAALPFVDVFAPAASAEDLAALAGRF